MRTNTFWLAFAGATTLALAPATAQSPGSGPTTTGPCHDTVEPVDVRIVAEGRIECDAGLLAAAGVPGVTREDCPRFIVVYPSHSKPGRSDQETGYVARFDREVQVTVHLMRCKSDYFLFFPIKDHCIVDRTIQAGQKDHYRLESCQLSARGIL